METFIDVIKSWPSATRMAEEVGVSQQLVAVWKHRNSIPSRHWNSLSAAAQARNIPVTIEVLAFLASSQTNRGRAAK
jgi:hypothetical protein